MTDVLWARQVTALETTLSGAPHNLPTLTLSIDDFYLPYTAQRELAQSHPLNPLVQHRGQPSTHDLPLASSVFRQLRVGGEDVRIPAYDKSAHDGKGDREPEKDWRVVNRRGLANQVGVVIFEGWCVGFRPLSDEALATAWQSAVVGERSSQDVGDKGQLWRQRFEDVQFVNTALKGYDGLTE